MQRGQRRPRLRRTGKAARRRRRQPSQSAPAVDARVFIRCGVNERASLASSILHLTERLLAQYARRVRLAAFQRRCEQFRRFIARIKPVPDAGGKGGEAAATDGEPADDIPQGVMSAITTMGECIAIANAAVAAAYREREEVAAAEVMRITRQLCILSRLGPALLLRWARGVARLQSSARRVQLGQPHAQGRDHSRAPPLSAGARSGAGGS